MNAMKRTYSALLGALLWSTAANAQGDTQADTGPTREVVEESESCRVKPDQSPPVAERPEPAPVADLGPTAKNALYANLAGPAILWSFHYERRFGDFAPGIGFSYTSFFEKIGSTSEKASILFVPLTLNYLGFGGRTSKPEVGAGLVGVYASDQVGGLGEPIGGAGLRLYGTVNVGYRYQPTDGGILFRAGISPIIGAGGILPWPYLSFGAVF